MKKLLLLSVVFFTIAFATAQEQQDRMIWYYSIGAVANPDYKINDNLRAAGAHKIADFMPSFSVGWGVVKDKMAIDVDFGVATVLNGKKDRGYTFVQAPISLKVQYIGISKEKYSLSGGLNMNYVLSDLAVYSKDTQLDLNNLNPQNNNGYLRINNQSFYIGPTVSFKFLKHKKSPLKLTAGYDFSVYSNKWKSDYASVANSVKEKGGRGYIQLIIPFSSMSSLWVE